MIPLLVFSDLTSISSSLELERECPREELEPTDSDNSKESPRRKPSNGSLRLSEDPFFEQIVAPYPCVLKTLSVFFVKYFNSHVVLVVLAYFHHH
jgi:hypothetical protein